MAKILFEGKEFERKISEERTVRLFGGIFQLHAENNEVIAPVKLLFADKLPKLLKKWEEGDMHENKIINHYIEHGHFMKKYFPKEADTIRDTVNMLCKDKSFYVD